MQSNQSISRNPLLLWPGVVAVTLQWLARFVVPRVMPEALVFGVFGGLAGGLAVLIWWLFFSRAPKAERWSTLLLIVAAMAATMGLVDASIAKGMMGFMLYIYAIPVVSLALVASAVLSRGFTTVGRHATFVVAILLACGMWTLLRTNGITGSMGSDLTWRWSETAEERLLAHANDKPMALPPVEVAAVKTPEERERVEPKVEEKAVAVPVIAAAVANLADWPGFRGPNRSGVVAGVKIETNWAATPPVQMWRRPIGPGWSSFAVRGGLLYTQEQRGDSEVVACYRVDTGEPVWIHRDAARFWESNAGAGPRGTPAISNGRVYTFGATGIVNALDARNGAVVWSRNAGTDTGAKLPGWGFSSSPLVMGEVVIVAASGRLVAYEIATGKPRWFGPKAGGGYSSPHPLTIDGVEQVLFISDPGAVSLAVADGAQLWGHAMAANARIVQPALTADGDVLIAEGDGRPLRRIAVSHGAGGWVVEERWSSTGLKPYFNDFVVHGGHAFGFDGGILACIDLKDGKRKWKGGRYGHGQLVLLAEQDLLLVLSEEGELALVSAGVDQFTEVAKFPAIQGKTWNHPVLAGDVLLVRNGEEMAAFRLSILGRQITLK